MDEKHAPMPPPIRRGLSPLRLVLVVVYLGIAGLTYWHFQPRPLLVQPTTPASPSRQPVATAGELVPLEAHIMSKCPDAKVGRVARLACRCLG
jgi:hypothetical protein